MKMTTNMKPSLMRMHAIAMYMETKVRESGFNVNYTVRNVYADLGAGITHETVVVEDSNGGSNFQIFTPGQVSDVENGIFKPADADKMIASHIESFTEWNTPRLS